MKINLGSGSTKVDGYISVDIDQSVKPDVVCDIRNPLPFYTDTVEEVRAYHILEHIGPEFFDLLKEIYRVCKNDAIIDVRVPHHRHDYFFGDPTHVRPITLEAMRLFSKVTLNGLQNFGNYYNVNFVVYWYQYILEPYFESQFKSLPDDQCDMIARMYNNVIQEIHFKMRVVK